MPRSGRRPGPPLAEHLRRWGAAYLLVGLFAASWFGQWVTMDAPATEFWAATLENWQSEFLQLGLQAVVVVGYAHVMFAKATEDAEDMRARLQRIEARMEEGR